MIRTKVFLRFFLVVMLVGLIFPVGVQADGDSPPEGASPFQQALQEYIAEREAAGEPVPASVVYNYEVTEPIQTPMLRTFNTEPQDEQGTIITATTTIFFENPQQARAASGSPSPSPGPSTSTRGS